MLATCGPPQRWARRMSYAETIMTGGRIFRGLHEGFAEAVAIAGGRVVAVGDRASVLSHVQRAPASSLSVCPARTVASYPGDCCSTAPAPYTAMTS